MSLDDIEYVDVTATVVITARLPRRPEARQQQYETTSPISCVTADLENDPLMFIVGSDEWDVVNVELGEGESWCEACYAVVPTEAIKVDAGDNELCPDCWGGRMNLVVDSDCRAENAARYRAMLDEQESVGMRHARLVGTFEALVERLLWCVDRDAKHGETGSQTPQALGALAGLFDAIESFEADRRSPALADPPSSVLDAGPGFPPPGPATSPDPMSGPASDGVDLPLVDAGGPSVDDARRCRPEGPESAVEALMDSLDKSVAAAKKARRSIAAAKKARQSRAGEAAIREGAGAGVGLTTSPAPNHEGGES